MWSVTEFDSIQKFLNVSTRSYEFIVSIFYKNLCVVHLKISKNEWKFLRLREEQKVASHIR